MHEYYKDAVDEWLESRKQLCQVCKEWKVSPEMYTHKQCLDCKHKEEENEQHAKETVS